MNRCIANLIRFRCSACPACTEFMSSSASPSDRASESRTVAGSPPPNTSALGTGARRERGGGACILHFIVHFIVHFKVHFILVRFRLRLILIVRNNATNYEAKRIMNEFYVPQGPFLKKRIKNDSTDSDSPCKTTKKNHTMCTRLVFHEEGCHLQRRACLSTPLLRYWREVPSG